MAMMVGSPFDGLRWSVLPCRGKAARRHRQRRKKPLKMNDLRRVPNGRY